MPGMKAVIVGLFALLVHYVLSETFDPTDENRISVGHTPTYCVDPKILDIIKSRTMSCFHGGGTAFDEYRHLRNLSVADFHRSHELLAYLYFVEYKDNPHRRPCEQADFEYIPLLPLAWKSDVPTSTYCTAGGYCPRKPRVPNTLEACSVRSLINGIIDIVKYVKTVRNQAMDASIPKFTVASTYNLRTFMGYGLPSASRSGPMHAAVTSFVTATHIGHYERQVRYCYVSLVALHIPLLRYLAVITSIASFTAPLGLVLCFG
jgi:hypothetical protein